MYLKIHESYRRVVAVCDSNLLGKKFEEGKSQLDIRETFYKGEEIDGKKLSEIYLREKTEDSTFNIVGEESVKIALELGIITEGNIGKVNGIPFALSLL